MWPRLKWAVSPYKWPMVPNRNKVTTIVIKLVRSLVLLELVLNLVAMVASVVVFVTVAAAVVVVVSAVVFAGALLAVTGSPDMLFWVLLGFGLGRWVFALQRYSCEEQFEICLDFAVFLD